MVRPLQVAVQFVGPFGGRTDAVVLPLASCQPVLTVPLCFSSRLIRDRLRHQDLVAAGGIALVQQGSGQRGAVVMRLSD